MRFCATTACMHHLLLVAAGGAAGASARHQVNIAAHRAFGGDFPLGTLLVNVLGCLAMGAFIELLALRLQGSPALRLLVATGFLGGFTTFSSFSLDFAVLWERGATGLAFAYAGASVLFSLAALFVGLWLVRAIA